ncbi:prepilin-type N-terminal cleavage/methylation domain-containing protein [Chitinibacter sp. S2-10]|uniref:prepilin-type N-terminal cleavage/methylation domain-containing protein n=1 Tax=Chitinibacter sp. S2-10 TaxID=3373597 RepID=UPI003977DDE0
MQAKQGGFSLLELLVVVAIIAAIAAGSTAMINSADKNAKAGINADAIDSTFKSIATFKVLNNSYPDYFDSLVGNSAGDLATADVIKFLSPSLSTMLLSAVAVSASQLTALTNVGINHLQVVDTDYCGATTASATLYFTTKSNKALVGNSFKVGTGIPTDSECGASVSVNTAAQLVTLDAANQGARLNVSTTNTIVAFGVGPSSTLFNANYAGALYRAPQDSSLAIDKYNRYIAFFDTGLDTAPNVTDGATLVAVVSARGKTFDEELGIWNGAL